VRIEDLPVPSNLQKSPRDLLAELRLFGGATSADGDVR